MSPTADTPLATAIPRHRNTAHYGTGPDERLVPLAEVMFLLGYGRTSIYELIKLEKFSRPVKGGVGDSSRWPLGEIREFLRNAVAARGVPKQSPAGAGAPIAL
jgi:predicted DNA-binding transcriptional regulator AlpA